MHSRNLNTEKAAVLICISIALLGCGPKATTGGTTGRLLSGDKPLPQMQVIAHRSLEPGFEPIAMGFTSSGGIFELVQPDGSAAIELPPADYRWSVHSIGAEVSIPQKFADADKTDLQATWSESGEPTLRLPKLRELRISR